MADEQKAKVARTEPGHSQGKLLTGKKALITGASRGIGRAVALALASENATVIVSARSVKDLEETVSACKSKGAADAHVCPADMSSIADVDQLAKTVLQQFGPIDILVNNAGIATRMVEPRVENDPWKNENPIEGNPDTWSKVLATNLEAPMRLTRAFTPSMAEKKQGTIINISSIAGIDRLARAPVYSASKWGLRGWSKCIYEALRPHGIKVSNIAPGLVDTSMTTWVQGERSMFIQPEDIAEACMFVCRCSANSVPEEIVVRTVQHISGM